MKTWTGLASSLVLARRLVLFAFLASVSGPGFASAAPTVDLLRLRDAVCAHETRGEADPDDALGRAGEIGRCQIKPGTARQVGYQGTNVALFRRETNEYWALVKIAACAQKYVTVKGLAWCFNRGLNAGKVNGTDKYVLAVEAEYNRKKQLAQR